MISTQARRNWRRFEDALKQDLGSSRQYRLSKYLERQGALKQDLGVSRTQKPKRHEVLYPDHVWQNADGSYSVASSKSRDFASFSPEQIIRQVKADVDEAMQKYAGKLYVRRRTLRQEMPLIEVTEIVLNYDSRLLSRRVQRVIKELAEEYAQARWPNCFFQLAFYRL